MKSKIRISATVSSARQLYVGMAKEKNPQLTLEELGSGINRYDHATVRHNLMTYQNLMETERPFRALRDQAEFEYARIKVLEGINLGILNPITLLDLDRRVANLEKTIGLNHKIVTNE